MGEAQCDLRVADPRQVSLNGLWREVLGGKVCNEIALETGNSDTV